MLRLNRDVDGADKYAYMRSHLLGNPNKNSIFLAGRPAGAVVVMAKVPDYIWKDGPVRTLLTRDEDYYRRRGPRLREGVSRRLKNHEADGNR